MAIHDREGLDRDDLVRMITAIAGEADLLARHIRTALSILANTDRKSTSSRFIANGTGMGRRHVRNALADLVGWNVLEVVPGEGSRGDGHRFTDPTTWSIQRDRRSVPILELVGHGGSPQNSASGPSPRPTKPAQHTEPRPTNPRTVGHGGRPQTPEYDLVGHGGRHKVTASAPGPERKSNPLSPELEELEAVNRKFATYPNPKTGRPRTVRRLDAGRLNGICREQLKGDRSRLPKLLASAIDGYVCRNGITVQESGYNGWDHFELETILRKSHLEQNLNAAIEAHAIGNRPPFKRGAHSEKRSANKPKPKAPRGPLAPNLDPILKDLEARAQAFAQLTPEEQLERKRADIIASGEDSKFRRDRVARVDQELAVLRAGGS